MPLEHFLPQKIADLAQRVGAAIHDVHGGRFGLSRDEWRVLDAVAAADAQPTRLVQEATGLDKVAVSRAASALEDRGLIRRTERSDDRRIKILHLTEAGAETLAEVERIVRAREAYLLEALDGEARAVFERALAALTERADALAHPDTGARCRPDCSGACERAVDFLDFTPDAPAPRPGPEPAETPAPARREPAFAGE